MKRVIGLVAALAVAAAAVLAFGGAVGSAKNSKQSATPFVVGLAGAQTGFMSFFDNPVSNGARIAVAEFNRKGGVNGHPIKLIAVDSKTDPAASAAAAQQLIDSGAHALITITDYDLGGPAARVAATKGVLAFSGAGSPKFGFTGLGGLAYDMNAGTPTQAAAMALAAWQQGFRRPYLLEDTSLEFTKSQCAFFADAWQHYAKKKVVGHDTFGQGDPSVATQITRLKNVKPAPDAIVLCSYPPGGASVIKQLRAAGVKTAIVTNESFDAGFWIKAVPNVSNVFHTSEGSLGGDDPRPPVNAFMRAYRAKYGVPPTSYVLFGYAAIEALVKGAKQAKSIEPKAIARALDKWRNQPTIFGPTTFTPKCHQSVGRGFPLMRWTNGKDRFVKFIKPTYVPKTIC